LQKNKSIAGLVIQPGEAATLTKEQQEFNFLLNRMQKAELKLEEERALLDTLLAECISKVYPLHKQVMLIDFQVVVELHKYFQHTPLSALRKKAFSDLLKDMIELIINSPNGLSKEQLATLEEINDTILTAFQKKRSKKQEALNKEEEFINLQITLENELYSKGFNIDLSDLKIDMSPEEINRHIEEKLRNYIPKGHGASKDGKKTKKQLAQEEKQREIEELKGKSLSVMYKTLVKILHPDLEQDPEKKIQKEHWMKMLTVAYEKKDLKSLLEIELEWAKGETTNIQSITAEKLALYNEMLLQQAQELEKQVLTVGNENKYELLSYFTNGTYHMQRWRPAFSIKKLDQKRRNSEIILEVVERHDEKTKKLIDKVLKDRRQSNKEY
jgi:hypothetical protein